MIWDIDSESLKMEFCHWHYTDTINVYIKIVNRIFIYNTLVSFMVVWNTCVLETWMNCMICWLFEVVYRILDDQWECVVFQAEHSWYPLTHKLVLIRNFLTGTTQKHSHKQCLISTQGSWQLFHWCFKTIWRLMMQNNFTGCIQWGAWFPYYFHLFLS